MKTDTALWSRISKILDAALDLPADQRREFIQTACEGDTELLTSVENLLAADEQSEGFLESSVAEHAANLIASTQDSEEQSITIGAFRTTRLLGYGGMGLVYLAQRADGEFDQQVAIKCMRSIMRSEELQKQFLAERQILASLQHPGIAHLVDGGVTENGHPYFAMEYVDGEKLTDHCDHHELQLKDRIGIFLKVCSAISYAHAKLIIHRDIKPSNILVVSEQASDTKSATAGVQVKLLDFGIARFLDEEQQLTSEHGDIQPLTIEYAAPEQLLNQAITTSTDVYSMGLLLYQLLSGELAHGVEGKSLEQAKIIICEQVPDLPSTAILGSDLPTIRLKRRRRQLLGDIDAIVMKTLQKSPEDRYSSVEALAGDLRRYLGLLPVTARSGSWWYRLRKFLYRYRLGVSATGLVLGLLIYTTFSTIQSNQQIRQALETAQQETAKATEISVFLHELFEVANPFVRNGEQVSVIELLNRGTERISTDLSGQPETQSQLMFELARIHNSLGLYSRASEMLDQCLEIQHQLYGTTHVDIARSLHWKSIILDNLGAYGDSEVAAEAALAMRQQLLGPDHPDLGESMDRLGSLLAYSGQKERALNLAYEAVRILDTAVGEEDPRTQTARHNLAWMLGTMGRYEEATPIYEQVITVAGRVAGEEHPETLETLNNFGVMLRHQGELARAEEVYRQVLSSRIRLLGIDHPQVGVSQNNLAKLLQEKGDLEEATDLYQRALKIFMVSYGAQHSNVAVTQSNLAQVLYKQGRSEESEIYYRQALAIHRKNSPQGSIKVASTLVGLGQLLAERGDANEANSLLVEALAIQQKYLEPDHWEIGVTQLQLGRVLILQNEFEQAKTMLQQSDEILSAHYGEGHDLVTKVREALSLLEKDLAEIHH